jgi:hypothetical protein
MGSMSRWAFGFWLKLFGFLLNISASLYLMTSVLFGKGKPNLWACLWNKELRERLGMASFDDLTKLNKKTLIISPLVIIGSSMQMIADIFDP